MPLAALEHGRAVELGDLRRVPRRARRQRRRQRRVPRRPLRAAPLRDGRGRGRREATDDEVDDDGARARTRRSTPAGSASRPRSSYTHSDGDGKPVASRWATPRRGARAVRRGAATTRARRSRRSPTAASTSSATTRSSCSRRCRVAGRRPLNWNVLTVDSRVPERYRASSTASTRGRGGGGRVVALTMPVLVPMNMSFRTYCALFMLPGWSEVMSLPVPERIEKLQGPRDPQVDERAGAERRGRRVPAPRRLGATTSSATRTRRPTRA